ncbi:hypothetical protein RHMOL_Rhmol06G0163300 [Rhododendron molle]|uniref:Uncharacterized protein n=1 Tax=Rhododendron molle TaxID=49168 RepID=A0ACC0NEY8_RHOML|nr:hypothetical protein RHMOL_Rhmol06G0163300 [Rhododendron molle]
MTESAKRVNFAKVCVEVDLKSSLPHSFDLITSSGQLVIIDVKYPWRPAKFNSCGVFGHFECGQNKEIGHREIEIGQIGSTSMGNDMDIVETEVVVPGPSEIVEYGFLPSDLGDGMIDPDAVFLALKGISFQSLLFKLVLAAAVYHIWMERNSRIFGGRSRCAPEVLDGIDEYIRSRVSSWKVIPSSVENQSMCELWRRIFGPGIPRVFVE